MNSWKQVRVALLGLVFTAVVLVLVRVILVTAFHTKEKKSSELPNFPLPIAALIEET